MLAQHLPKHPFFNRLRIMQSKIQVGLFGFGNVGKGVFEILNQNQAAISQRLGRTIQLKTVVVRDPSRYQEVHLGDIRLSVDPDDIFNDSDIDIVIEVIGGEYPAYDFICKALKAKKHVVTANKEVIAKHKDTLFQLAKEHDVDIYFEASVGGGIPIIRSFKVGYSANQISEIYGILNGTTNYILTQMLEKELAFDMALKQAQDAGFAEADPTGDISGLDAAYKLIILAFVAFKIEVQVEDIHYKGIEDIRLKDLKYVQEMGFAIRLLAYAHYQPSQKNVLLTVCPMLVPLEHPLAQVKNEFNAIFSIGNAMGESMIYGKGAGSFPTGSAIISDLVDIAFDIDQNTIGRRNLEIIKDKLPLQSLDTNVQSFFVLLTVKDETGVLEEVVHVFSEYQVGIDRVRQKTQDNGTAELLFITHKVLEKTFNEVKVSLESLNSVNSLDQILRVLV